jgi:hypothetical protein
MTRPSRFLLAAAAVAALFAAGAASAQSQRYYDPPSRVARISDMQGAISYSPAGDGEWYNAPRNRPLVRGDQLWSDRNSRAEVQAGATWIRMDSETSLELTQLDDHMLQVEVAEGTVNLRVRQLYPGQRVEVDTPNLAFVIDHPGSFRLDVDRNGDNTTIEARLGGGRVFGVGGRFDVRQSDVVVFYGEDVRDYEMYAFPGMDSFDRYSRERNQLIADSQSRRYLGDDVVGYSDLDRYGRWSSYPSYGNVWFPSNVYAGWAPYQDGQWVWQDPWGWTWVDDQPWGFAPSHYGRWAWINGRWGWVPGQRSYRPVYAPALVAFMELAGNSIGWFPLGPSDVYYPTYNVSSNYFRAVNIANTNVSPTTVNKVYSSYGRANSVPLAQGSYRNRSVPTAVTAVPQDVFVNSRSVRQARREAREAAAATPPRGMELRRNLGVRPQRASVVGATTQANVRPPQAVQDEQVIVHNAPPSATPTPAATSTPAPAPPVRQRQHRFRQVTEQQAATDARATGPRHQGESAAAATPPATPVEVTPTTATAPGGRKLRALDREALPRLRGRRFQDRNGVPPAPAAPTTAPAPAPAAQAPTPAVAPTTAPAAQAPAPAPQSDQARQAEEARAAQQKAREEQRQAREAQRAAQQQKQESEAALRQAQQQESAAADAKAVQERQQAREAAREAQRQQREAQQAQREAQKQQSQAQAAQPATPKPATPATPATPVTPKPEAAATAPAGRPMPHAECVPQERIDAMRKRGVPEERIAQLKVCPVQPQQ